MKAKVTWKGEEGNDRKEVEWNGHTFKKGEAVEITDEETIRKAHRNQFFEVNVTEGELKHESLELQRPPSDTTSPQHPAQKPGEPIPREERERPELPPPTVAGGGARGPTPSRK
jgi:hypothetical protein